MLAQNFIVDYFRTPNFLGTTPLPSSSTSTRAPQEKKNAFEVLASSSGGTAIHRTEKQPLYLQHHGHSRTIVGIEIGKGSKVDEDDGAGGGGGANTGHGRGRTIKSKIRGMASKGKHGDGEGGEEDEVWLLLFDPGKCVDRSCFFSSLRAHARKLDPAQGPQRFPPRRISPIDTACLLFHRPIPQDFKKAAASLAAARQAQQADNGLAQEEDGSPPASKKPRPDQSASTARCDSPTEARRNGFGSAARRAVQQPLPKFGEVLKLFRVNMRELKKKDDYQVCRCLSLFFGVKPCFQLRGRVT